MNSVKFELHLAIEIFKILILNIVFLAWEFDESWLFCAKNVFCVIAREERISSYRYKSAKSFDIAGMSIPWSWSQSVEFVFISVL